MTDRPARWRPEVGEVFQFPGVAAAYRHRPTHPPAVFDVLVGLIAGEPRVVLDLGCGTGNVARPLAPLVDRVDAIDISAAMVEEGKRLPDDAAAFDAAVRRVVEDRGGEDVELDVVGEVIWGHPLRR